MKNLTPFSQTAQTGRVQVKADLHQVSAQQILLQFSISGSLELVSWPPPTIIESRQDGLWKFTCLEAFIGKGGQKSDPYTEINCSPNGDWNAYDFSSYREGMTLSKNITVRLKERIAEGNSALFQIAILSTEPLNAPVWGLSAVLEFIDGEKSYWSLKHPGTAADFHDKQGWNPPATR